MNEWTGEATYPIFSTGSRKYNSVFDTVLYLRFWLIYPLICKYNVPTIRGRNFHSTSTQHACVDEQYVYGAFLSGYPLVCTAPTTWSQPGALLSISRHFRIISPIKTRSHVPSVVPNSVSPPSYPRGCGAEFLIQLFWSVEFGRDVAGKVNMSI